MCRFKSGIILKNRVVLAPEGNESHSDLLESLNIPDTHLYASKVFVRAELTPENGNKAEDINKWKFRVDQDIVPDWFEEDPDRYEKEFRDAVGAYIKDKFCVIAGRAWSPIKTEGNKTYYLSDGILIDCTFGDSNNYANSRVRKYLNESKLAAELKNELGDRLVPISTNLLSLDGLDDYGTVEGDILAIPTIDLYRECRKDIPKIEERWWLATPDSTPSGYGSDYVLCIDSLGRVDCYWRSNVRGVRPFFIVQ